jgi:ribulose-5-phosphate 4-epimerase/fuculose-1-phosphate aldolase
VTAINEQLDTAGDPIDAHEHALRVDLAAAFRLAASFDWIESVGNHFSAVVSHERGTFLMNPRWKHFSLICASDLLLLDWNDSDTMSRPDAPDLSGWCIHSQVHALVPNAKVILHAHPPYATALAGLVDPTLKPIEQVTARFFNRVANDLDFDGVANNEDEGRRIAGAVGNSAILMMGNHGVTATGATVAEAFEELYLFERACRTMVLAYSTGQPLNTMSDDIAEQTARGWDACHDMAFAHFGQLKAKLNHSDPQYVL